MTRVCILELIEDMTLHRLLAEMNSCNHIDLKTKHVHDNRPQSPPDTHPTPNTPSPVQPRIQKVRGGGDNVKGGCNVIIKQYVI